MRKMLFVLLVLSLFAGVTQAGLITGVDRRNSTRDPIEIAADLQEDSLTFVDRTHEYNQVPAVLLGADYVKTANNDKSDGDVEIDVTLGSACTLYLIVDNRVGGTDGGEGVNPDMSSKMTWVADLGFVDTGLDIGIDESGTGEIDQWSSLFSAEVAAATITLLAQDDGGSRNNYGVAAVPEPATIALLGLGGLALIRRKRS